MGQSGRRRFLVFSGALLAAPFARTQNAKSLPVLGILSPHRKPPPESGATNPLRKRMEELGWFVGKTHLVESAYGDGHEERLPELAATLVAKKVDVIWALGPEAAVAAARATKTIPIVFWGVAYPVEQGLVESFARPGRNATGVAWSASPEFDAKRVQLLREIAPDGRRLAHLNVPSAVSTVSGGRVATAGGAVDGAARSLGFELRKFPVLKAADFEPAFAAIVAWGAQALLVAGTTVTARARKPIAEFALRERLPAIYTLSGFVEAGGLISYAIDRRATMARSMDYVDRILRGAKPAELPVDLPSHYELAVNLKTARALGLTIPQSILLRADRVIE